ncbi:MAG: DUF502 domain-containing protein [Candidatus Zixiibacteriota bacterium]
MAKSLPNLIKRYFLSGLLVVAPVILTYLIVKFLFELIDGVLEPAISKVLGYYTVGLGLVITLLLILLAGVLTRNFLGATLHKLMDRILARLPIISPIYSSAKQLLEAVTIPSRGSFKEVVLVEYPRKGVLSMGFVTCRVEILAEGRLRSYATVLIPSTPTPFSGMAVLFPIEELIPVSLTIEEALKFLVSGGVVTPESIQEKIGDAKLPERLVKK